MGKRGDLKTVTVNEAERVQAVLDASFGPVTANDRQVGGYHYKQHGATGEQHWDRVARLQMDPFQANITKYVERWRDKGGLQDLQKARHYLDKYIELIEAGTYQSS